MFKHEYFKIRNNNCYKNKYIHTREGVLNFEYNFLAKLYESI